MAETTSGQMAYSRSYEADAPAVAAGSDKSTIVGEVQEAGIITGVSYTPVANSTGDNTESRTYTLVNKGSDGNGTTVAATLALTTGNNMADFDEKAFTLGVAANLV